MARDVRTYGVLFWLCRALHLVGVHRAIYWGGNAVFWGALHLRNLISFIKPRISAGFSISRTYSRGNRSNSFVETIRNIRSGYSYEHPVVLPHVSHFMQVPFRTSVKLPHSEHISPS